MYSLVFIIATFAAVSARDHPIRFKDWTGYKEGDRYFYFAGDDGKIYLVDSMEEVDEEAISNYTCCPVNNGYWVYTVDNPKQKDVLIMGDQGSVLQSNFNPRKRTVFTSHGWTGDGNTEMNLLLTKVLLKKEDLNVIVLDWSTLAKKNYVTARIAAPKVGRMLGKFIKWLHDTFDMSYDSIHLVGHSLGGHVVGNAGKELKGRSRRITDGSKRQTVLVDITIPNDENLVKAKQDKRTKVPGTRALDPAGPLWYSDKRNRVAKTDAKYVEVIHTNRFACGYPFPSGHADFYPNGGKHMVGCRWWDIECHHARSWRYMASSIERNGFIGNKCKNLLQAWHGPCTGKNARMGNNDFSKQLEGIFRLKTTANYPYIPIY